MNKKVLGITVAVVAALSVTGSVITAQAAGSGGDGTSKQVKITKQQAVAIAKKALPGTVVGAELDRDDGVLLYEVELRTEEGEAEVDVAAYGGKVLSIDLDRDDDDRDDNRDDDRYDADRYDRDDRYDDDWDDRDDDGDGDDDDDDHDDDDDGRDDDDHDDDDDDDGDDD